MWTDNATRTTIAIATATMATAVTTSYVGLAQARPNKSASHTPLCARHPTIVFMLIVVAPASSAAILVECKARDLPMAQHVNRNGGSTLTSRLAKIAQH